jgi:hypothetical protein
MESIVEIICNDGSSITLKVLNLILPIADIKSNGILVAEIPRGNCCKCKDYVKYLRGNCGRNFCKLPSKFIIEGFYIGKTSIYLGNLNLMPKIIDKDTISYCVTYY